MTPDKLTTQLNPDEFRFLMEYWELRSPAEVAAWALNLAHELTKAESHGWSFLVTRDGSLPVRLPIQFTLPDDQGQQAHLVQDDGSIKGA